jgi:glycosyl transferase, family 8
LEQYPNLILYPSFDPLTSRKVLGKIDFYLDINPFDEVDHITETIHQLGLPIFSFEGTNHDHTGKNQVFKNDQVDQMVEVVQDYIDTIER